MRATLGILTVGLAFLLPTGSEVEARVGEGQIQISPVMGIATPVSDLKYRAGRGYICGLSTHYMIADRTAFGLEISVSRFSPTVRREFFGWFDQWPPLFADITYSVKLVNLGLLARQYLTAGQSPNPFVEAGVVISTEIMATSTQISRYEELHTVPGLCLRVGMDLRVTSMISTLPSVTYYAFDNFGTKGYRYLVGHIAFAFQFRPI